MKREFRPQLALEVLARHRVRFVMIGGLGAVARGSPSITHDLDICYARDGENLERLASALQELKARLRGAPADVPFILDAKTLRMGDCFTFVTEAGALDCLGTPAGVGGYDELIRSATEEQVGDFKIAVASIDDLIRMKEAAGRPKDRIELEILGALREEIDAAEERKRRRKKPPPQR